MGTGTSVSTGDWITAAKQNLKLEDLRDMSTLGLLDNSGAGTNEVLFNVNETNTADRTLNLLVNNADRTINLSGNLVLGGTLTTAAAFTTTTAAITLAANGAGSSVTLPASGTLATLAGSEQFTNKTLASGTLTGTFTCTSSVVNFTTGSITFTTGNLTISGAGYISIGANPASAGYFRISNAQYLVARNAAAGGDVNMIQVSANDFVKLGTASIEIATANVVTLTFSNPAATRTITFADPLGADSVAYLAATQTLTNKTLTSPTINAGTLSGTFSGAITLSGATITLTGNLLNFTAGGAFTFGTTDAQTLILKTGGSTRWTWAAASSNVTLAGAADVIAPANTAATFRVTDGTTAIISLDSRNTVTGVVAVTLSASAPTIASAAGDAFSVVSIPAVTSTWTGVTGITALNGLALNIAQPVATNVSAGLTATTASTVYIANAPSATGNLTITNAYALHVAAGTTQLQATNVAGTLTMTSALINITAGGAATIGTTDANTLALKTGGTTRWTLAAASGNLTAAGASDIIVLNTTASVFRVINVAGTLSFTVDSQTATDNVVAFTFTGGPPTIANAAGTTYNVVKHAAVTVTLSGATGVTAMSGISLYLDAPTLTSATNPAVALASTLYVAAPVAGGTATITAGYSAHFASQIRVDGNINIAAGAVDLVVKADTAATWEIYDSTTKIVTINSQITTDSIVGVTITGPAVTVAAAAGSTYSAVSIAARTHTFTGNTGVTAMNGLQLNLGAPTITSAGTPAVALASTLYVAAPVAAGTATITAGYSAHFASQIRVDGNVSLANAAYDIVVIANTAAALEISDGTTKLLTFDSRNTVTGVVAANFSASPATIASAAGVTYSQVGVAAKTTTVTGTDAVTAMNGLQLNLGVPTITNVSAGLTITTASTLYVALPVATGNATITSAWTINAAGAIRLDGNLSMANAAYDLVIKLDTAAAFEIYDSATKLLTVDTRTTTDNVEVHTWTAPAPTFASAAGSTWIHHSVAPVTVTLTGGVGVTAMDGVQMYLAAPTVTSGAVTTVTTASTLYVAAPLTGGAVTITNGWAINSSGAIRLDGNLSMANAAYDIVFKANTAAALELSDGTTKYLTIDDQTATDNITAFAFDASDPTFASANGSTWRMITINAATVNLTGGVQVTAMNGLSLYINQIILAANQATTVVTASALYLTPPGIGANMAITNNYMINTSAAGCFLTAAGVWTDASSRQGKEGIKELDVKRVPKLLDEVKVVSYRRKDKYDGGFERFGLIAEDAPDFVADPSHKGVSAGYLAGFGMAAIKWLQKEVKELKTQNEKLSKQVAALQAA